jgi:pimeloyl-[acyl-carrier protein] methyl ester esterase
MAKVSDTQQKDGEPLWCLLPGMHGTAELFRPFLDVAPFAKRCQIIEYPSNESDYESLTAHVRARLPEQPCIILAESFSGPIAVIIATHPPANLLGIVLCATFLDNPRSSPFRSAFPFLKPLVRALNPPRWILRRVLTGNTADEKLNNLIVMVTKSMNRETLIKRIQSILKCDVREAFRQCQVPVLCMNASDDLLVRNPINAGDASNAGSVRVVEIKGPHLLLQTKSAEISEFLQNFEREVAAKIQRC